MKASVRDVVCEFLRKTSLIALMGAWAFVRTPAAAGVALVYVRTPDVPEAIPNDPNYLGPANGLAIQSPVTGRRALKNGCPYARVRSWGTTYVYFVPYHALHPCPR
jgi:hypothetical protein